MSSDRLEGALNGITSPNGSNGSHKAAETSSQAAAALAAEWSADPRWAGVQRSYSADDVIRLRGSVQEEHTLARIGAERLWSLLQSEPYVNTLGALTGNQAVQQVRAGLKAIYLSGWQVAADANLAGQTYPDQSLYPVNSVPQVVRRINNALMRADQIAWAEAESGPGGDHRYWLAPIVADAEAGFGGVLNAFELMKSMIAAGAAGVHWEDQLASEKKCGHLGGKVLIPTSQHVKTLNAARLAADICGTRTLIVARTDAESATLLTSDIDERDAEFLTGERTGEGDEHQPVVPLAPRRQPFRRPVPQRRDSQQVGRRPVGDGAVERPRAALREGEHGRRRRQDHQRDQRRQPWRPYRCAQHHGDRIAIGHPTCRCQPQAERDIRDRRRERERSPAPEQRLTGGTHPR